jgi:gliding motility-associated-like protein
VFDTISTGSYTLYVREKDGLGDGCEAELDFTIDNPPQINILITDKVEPSCDNVPQGELKFEAWGGTGNLAVSYNGTVLTNGILDAVTQHWKFQVEPDKGGWTVIEAKDDNGCMDTVMLNLKYATDLIFDKVRIVPNKCPDDTNAQIKVIAVDQKGSSHSGFTYRLYTGVATIPANLVEEISIANLTDSASFEGLANGTYVLSMQADVNGCFTEDLIVNIDNTSNIKLTNVSVVNDCPSRILFTIEGDPSNTAYEYSINGSPKIPVTVPVVNGVAENVAITNLVPGAYAVTVYYGECEYTETFTIQSRVKPTVTPHAVTGCYGEANGSIEITMPDNSGVPYTYWYSELNAGDYRSFTASLQTTITGLKAGDYQLVVQQYGGCYSDTIKVTVDDALRMNIGFNQTVQITCKGQYGEGDITVSGGSGSYAAALVPQSEGGYPPYANPPVLAGMHLSNVTGGLYRIAITDNGTGCRDTLELDIDAPRMVEIRATQPPVACATAAGQTSTITVEVMKPASGTFEYYINTVLQETTSTATYTYAGLTTGTYTIEVREQSTTCLADTVIAVDVPQPLITNFSITSEDRGNCNFAADIAVDITGGTAPYTIKMNNADVSSPVEGLPNGDYHFEIWDDNGCYADTIVKVELPTAILVDATIRDVNCNQGGNGSIVVTPTTPASYTYLWEKDDFTGSALYDLNAGDYKVTISNGSCSIDTVFTVQASYVIDVSITADGEDTHIFCPGADVVLNGLVTINGTPMSSTTPDAFANWILPNGDTKEYLTNNPLTLTAGNGIIQLTASSGGCTSMATFEMETKPTPTLAFATDTVYIPRDEAYILRMDASSDFVSYTWTSTPDASQAQGLPAPPADVTLASPDAPYTLTLTLTGENGCSTSDTIYVSRALDFFVPNAFTPNEDGNHDTWKFRNIDQYIDYYDIQVAVFNRGGFQVYSGKGYNNSSVVWDGRRNGNDLPIGTYYYVVKLVPRSSSGKTHTFKGSVTIIR